MDILHSGLLRWNQNSPSEGRHVYQENKRVPKETFTVMLYILLEIYLFFKYLLNFFEKKIKTYKEFNIGFIVFGYI